MSYGIGIRLLAAVWGLVTSSIALPAVAKYPERPVTIVVSVAPGAGPDVIARVLADRLTHLWKQQVVVLNRQGGGGILAAQAAAAANPDGYTLYMPVSSAFTVSVTPVRPPRTRPQPRRPYGRDHCPRVPATGTRPRTATAADRRHGRASR